MKNDLALPYAEKSLYEILKTKDSLIENKIQWTTLLSKIDFHLHEIKNGNDTDSDGKKHSVHLQYYSSVLTEYSQLHLKGDDRKHKYMKIPKIGLDIDEVIADWVTPWIEYYGLKKPTSWYFDKEILQRFDEMKRNGILDKFYLDLKPKIKGSEVPFEPVCYITSRPVSTEVTVQWLEKNGFPIRPVHTVGMGESKIEVAKKAGVEVFVDDRYENFREFNENGICCFLFDAAHNQRYNVGLKRIKSLNELPWLNSR